MAKYRKKPVVVEAVQWTGENWKEFLDFIGYIKPLAKAESACMIIRTLAGEMIAMPGDWIIKGVNGEFYPCKPDIFEKTYERVEEDEQQGMGILTRLAELKEECRILEEESAQSKKIIEMMDLLRRGGGDDACHETDH